MDKNAIKGLMCEIPHFDQLENEELEIMAEHVDFKKVTKGTTLVKEGTLGDSLFYIIAGEIEVKKETVDGRQAVLARFRKGAAVGEMALLEKASARSATAVTISDTELLVFTRKSFDELAENYPRIALKITQNIAVMIATRLRHTSGRFADIFR